MKDLCEFSLFSISAHALVVNLCIIAHFCVILRNVCSDAVRFTPEPAWLKL